MTYSTQEIRNTVAIVLYCILFITGVIGNGLIVLYVICTKKNPTFIILGSLAAADFLFIVGRLPQEIVSISKLENITTIFACKVKLFVLQLASYSAAYHLVLLAVVRYIYICHPFKALKYLTIKWAFKMIAFLWLGLVLLLSPLLFFTGTTVLADSTTFCDPNPDSPRSLEIFAICYSLFSYFLPLTMLIIFHSIKAREVRNMISTVTSNSKKQMSAMVIVVISLFGILMFPVHCKNFFSISGYMTRSELMLHVDTVFRVLAYTNSCINPIIYGVMSSAVQKNIKELFLTCKRKDQTESTSNSAKTKESNIQVSTSNI